MGSVPHSLERHVTTTGRGRAGALHVPVADRHGRRGACRRTSSSCLRFRRRLPCGGRCFPSPGCWRTAFRHRTTFSAPPLAPPCEAAQKPPQRRSAIPPPSASLVGTWFANSSWVAGAITLGILALSGAGRRRLRVITFLGRYALSCWSLHHDRAYGSPSCCTYSRWRASASTHAYRPIVPVIGRLRLRRVLLRLLQIPCRAKLCRGRRIDGAGPWLQMLGIALREHLGRRVRPCRAVSLALEPLLWPHPPLMERAQDSVDRPKTVRDHRRQAANGGR